MQLVSIQLSSLPVLPKEKYWEVITILKGIWNGQDVDWPFFADREQYWELLALYASNIVTILDGKQQMLRERIDALILERPRLLTRIEIEEQQSAPLHRRLMQLREEHADLLEQERHIQQLTRKRDIQAKRLKTLEAQISEQAERIGKLHTICQLIAPEEGVTK